MTENAVDIVVVWLKGLRAVVFFSDTIFEVLGAGMNSTLSVRMFVCVSDRYDNSSSEHLEFFHVSYVF